VEDYLEGLVDSNRVKKMEPRGL